MGLLLVFSLFFQFFIMNLVSSLIETSKIIVDDSQLLYDESKIIQSRQNACFFDSINKLYMKKSLQGSIMHHIYEKKVNPDKPCTVTNIRDGEAFKNHFILLTSFHSFILQFIASLQPDKDMFSSNRPIESVNVGFLLAKVIDKNLREIINRQW